MQRPRFVNNKIYHIYNRGVDKRNIFMQELDYLRFIHDLFEFNDQQPAPKILSFNKSEVGLPQNKTKREPRKLLVEILSFCLMPNHYHLLILQKSNNSITEFMRKLGTGYTNYFNQKYERTGVLFQGKFKAILIEDDSHFIHIPHYIHLNALDLIEPKWRNGEIKNYSKAIKFLENYRWSSYLDCIGKKNFPSVTQKDFLMKFFEGPKNYKKETELWLKERNFEEIKDKILE